MRNKLQDRLIRKASALRLPVMCALELLPVCNLSCKMCYVRKSMAEVRAAGGLKDGQWWLDIARQARELGLVYPLLTGGEPLLHPDFRVILDGMNQLGMQVSINSNGTLIDRDWVRWFTDHRPLRINLTLYGGSAQSYQDLCGDGDAFYRAREGALLLKEHQIPVKFNASLTPENVAELDDMVAFARKLQIPLQVATYMFPPTRRDSSMVGRNHRLSPEEAGLARVRNDLLQAEPEFFVGQAKRFGRFVPLDQLGPVGEPVSQNMVCRAGVCSFWVDWQGRLDGCGMYSTAQISLEDKPFDQAWQALTDHTAQVVYDSPCAQCPNAHLCHTCIAMVRNECGDGRERPEYLCRMNQASARHYVELARAHYSDVEELPTMEQPMPDICVP